MSTFSTNVANPKITKASTSTGQPLQALSGCVDYIIEKSFGPAVVPMKLLMAARSTDINSPASAPRFLQIVDAYGFRILVERLATHRDAAACFKQPH